MSTLIKRYIMKKLFLFLFSSCSSPISDNKYRTIINKMPYHFDPRYHSSTLEEFIFEDNFQEDNHEIEEAEEKGGFLEFLKEFAGKYWWLLVVLLSLIVLVYFIKTINY